MDLLHRQLGVHAHVVYNEYVTATGDLDGLAMLPLFLSARAAVRAKTSAAAAREYLDLALSLIEPAPARLVAIGGLSGAGKSTLARHLAPTLGALPGALVLRSDLVRKSMLGVRPADRLGSQGYTEGVTRGVYHELAARATTATAAGRAVVVDAAFADPRDRAVIADVAQTVGVPFTGLWLDAPVDTRAARATQRCDDVSDATAAVQRFQLERDIGEMDWSRLDATPDDAAVAQSAEALLGCPETVSS